MWYALAIIAILILIKPDILSGLISSASLVSVSSPSQLSSPVVSPVILTQNEPGESSENFLENPALRMMAGQAITQIKNVVQTGSMQAPTDIGGSLLTMFSGDLNQGGQIGEDVGLLAAPLVSSALSTTPDLMGVATIGGDVLMGEEAMIEAGAAPIGSLGFALAFPLMVVGQMIAGAFEESSPFSKAQQAVIAQWQASGSSRARFLNQKGFTDQQIIKWVADHPDFHYLYAICPWPIAGRGPQADGTYLRIDQHVVLQGLYSQEEKDWLDNFVKDLGLGFIEIVGGEATGISSVERTYADVEGYLGGWHQEYLSLDEQTKKFRETPTQAEVMATVLGGVSGNDLQNFMASNLPTQTNEQPMTQAEAESTIFFGG